MGFDEFYGFVGGEASERQRNVYGNKTAIYRYEDKRDWNVTTAMADEDNEHVKQLKEIETDKGFFV